MKKWESNAIKHIMDNFDFERVHGVMSLMGWAYDMGNGKLAIPSIDRIMDVAREDIELSIKDKCTVDSGGFVAEYHKNVIRLRFCIEDHDYYKSEHE